MIRKKVCSFHRKKHPHSNHTGFQAPGELVPSRSLLEPTYFLRLAHRGSTGDDSRAGNFSICSRLLGKSHEGTCEVRSYFRRNILLPKSYNSSFLPRTVLRLPAPSSC